MPAAATLPLAGRHIVVTRPAGQAVHLAEILIEQGATPVLFPVLEILPLADDTPLRHIATRLHTFDWAIFVSINAINSALHAILAKRSWPHHLRTATMGKSSEQALSAFGISNIISPLTRFDSEALLSLPEFTHMSDQKVVIFRGNNGRDLLGETLRARGATVEYCPSYQRRMPTASPEPLLRLWRDGTMDAIIVTSSEGLGNLHRMIGKLGQTWLRNTPVFAPHERIVQVGQGLGLQHMICTGAGDMGIVSGLCQYFADPAVSTLQHSPLSLKVSHDRS